MKIEKFDTNEELSCKAKEFIVKEIINKPDLLLCAATGGSPTGTYLSLEKEFQRKPGLFDKLKVIKLDEWGGIPMNHPSTCETYLQTHLLKPLQISGDRYTGFNSNTENPEKECARIQSIIDKTGPIDICILGFGMNGHIALNEPAEFLIPHCHVAKLSEKSLQHQMLTDMQESPKYGLTLGMAGIMHSKMILILINGSKKTEIVRKFLSKQISNFVPASLLWLHPNVTCLIVKDALGEKEIENA